MKTILPGVVALAVSIAAAKLPAPNQTASAGLSAPCVNAGTLTSAAGACVPNRFPVNGGERFPAVNLVGGENVRAVVSNVLMPEGATAGGCPVRVDFVRSDGSAGGGDTVSVKPGASAVVAADRSDNAETVKAKPGASASTAAPELLRAIVSVHADPADPGSVADPGGICAIRTAQEVFEKASGRTLYITPSVECLGNGACEAGLPILGATSPSPDRPGPSARRR